MKKAWAFLLIAIVIAAQYILIASFHSATSTVFGSENSAVIILKAKFAVARVHVQVFPHIDSQHPTVTFVFSDGSQKEVRDNYSFDVYLPHTGDFSGGFTVADNRVGITISNDSPIATVTLSNVTKDYRYELPGPYFGSGNIDVYWFRIEGKAMIIVDVNGMGI